MDKSSKAVDEAQRTLREIKAALAAMPKPPSLKATNLPPAALEIERQRVYDVFAVIDAERAYHAALRAERTPRVNCARCKRRFKPGEPMVWQWRWGNSAQWCLRCDRREHKGTPADRDLDQQPCETCARPMYFDGYSPYHQRRPLTCSYQCGCRRKVKRQLERKRVEHETVACVFCGEMFPQRRRDARTCSNKCRQALHRRARSDQVSVTPGCHDGAQRDGNGADRRRSKIAARSGNGR